MSENAPNPEAPKVSEERVKAAKEFFVLLRKGAKSIAIYQHQVARFGEFLRPAFAALAALVKDGPLSLKVTADSFCLGEEAVLGADGGENLPGRLFREGVRHLSFRPGVTDAEFARLVTILLSNERAGSSVVSQLADAGLQGIEYVVVEGFTVAGMTEEQVQVEVDQIVEYLYARLRGHTDDTLSHARISAADLELKLENVDLVRGVVFDGEGVSEAFRARVQQELQRDEAVRSHQQLLDTLLAALREGGLADVKPVVEILAQMIDGLTLQEDWTSLARIVAELEAMEAAQGPESAAGQARRGIAAQLGTSARILKMAESLKTNPAADTRAIAGLLARVEAGSVGPMCDGLEAQEQPEHRALFVEALAIVGREKPEFFYARLGSDKPQTVRDMVAIIDRIRPPDAGKHIGQALKSPNHLVRAEIASILGGSKDVNTAHRLLLETTLDKHPQVRATAFRSLAQVAPLRAAQDLMRLPKLPDWDKRPDDEKALIFDCMGQTETPEVLRYLLSLLQQKKTLFTAKKVLESKLLAVRALSCMENLQAVKLLQGVSESADMEPEVAAAARKGMLAVKRTMAEKARAAAAAAAAPAAERARESAETKAGADALFGEFSQARAAHAAEAADLKRRADEARLRMAEEELAAREKEAQRLKRMELRRSSTPVSVPAVPAPAAAAVEIELEEIDLVDEDAKGEAK